VEGKKSWEMEKKGKSSGVMKNKKAKLTTVA